MILGLDASTSTVGWCLLNQGKHVKSGYIDLKKHTSMYEKLKVLEEFVTQFSRTVNVVIEAPLARSNNQNVVNILQRWNGMVCAVLYQYFRKEPLLLPQRDCLKQCQIVVPKGIKGADRKKYILQQVMKFDIIPKEKWTLKKTGNYKDFCFDMADACVVALAATKNEKETNSKKAV